uniref:cytochrome c oxidase subunit 3 n=1 Tax=Oecleopsis sinicus TaxID=1308491 RepID=UPI0021B5E879|nr:cytochrome c oxidase subunit 3 [Oecleopsis sinicus]UVV36479.1 cytochrome c oxidase subunit 3 [Oecleopsis sinicus]
MKKNHPFHLVTNSPWPIISSMGILTMLMGLISWMHSKEIITMTVGTTISILSTYQWWRDITRESTFQGEHTLKVTKMMKMGMILFITSEVMFFLSFFWSFFHASLAPSMEIGMKWPPKGIECFNPMEIPLLNTIILLSSGASMTWAHQAIISNKLKKTKKALILTIIMGMIFSTLQLCEYIQAPFTISDSIYGSTFFMATGFHGLHVIIGTMFIMISTMRIMNMHMTMNHHSGLEMAAWYWHFVDVVWLFLYISIYWWGS